MIAGETEELGENLPQRYFVPPQIPHYQVRFRTPDRSGGKPATNRLSYGAALRAWLLFYPEDGGETSVNFYQIKRRHIPEDSNINADGRLKHKSYKLISIFYCASHKL
jgi:hypothetical protein